MNVGQISPLEAFNLTRAKAHEANAESPSSSSASPTAERIKDFFVSVGRTGEVSQHGPAPEDARQLTITPDQLVGAIDAMQVDVDRLLSKGIVPVNVVDLDGTLWSDSLNASLIALAVEKKQFKPEIRERLNEMMERYGVEPSGQDLPDRGVNQDVKRFRDHYAKLNKDWSPERRIDEAHVAYPFSSTLFAGFSERELFSLVDEVMQTIEGNVFEGMAEMMAALELKGVPTAVFSASFQPAVKHSMPYLGLSTEVGHGVNVETREDGSFSEHLSGHVTFREGKADAVQDYLRAYVAEHHPEWAEKLADKPLRPLLGQGDSPSKTDQQLLEISVLRAVIEPQSRNDVAEAVRQAQQSEPYFIVDYSHRVNGEEADTYDVNDLDAPEPDDDGRTVQL